MRSQAACSAVEPRAARIGQGVVAGAAVVSATREPERRQPLRFKRWSGGRGSLLDGEQIAGHLLDALRHVPAVHRLDGERAQHQEIERGAAERRFELRPSGLSASSYRLGEAISARNSRPTLSVSAAPRSPLIEFRYVPDHGIWANGRAGRSRRQRLRQEWAGSL